MVFFIRTIINCEVKNVCVEQLSLLEYVQKGKLLMLSVLVKFMIQNLVIFAQPLKSLETPCKMEMWSWNYMISGDSQLRLMTSSHMFDNTLDADIFTSKFERKEASLDQLSHLR